MNVELENTSKQPPENQPLIEGGDVQEELGQEPSFHERRHRAVTARRLAFLFAWMLAVSAAVHYGVTAFFLYKDRRDAAETLAGIEPFPEALRKLPEHPFDVRRSRIRLPRSSSAGIGGCSCLR